VGPETPQSEIPQDVEEHYDNGDRKKHKDENSNNDPWDRRQGDWHDEGDQQACGHKTDDGKENAENVSAACFPWLQHDMRK
jgi:hypothetical protein